MDGRIFAIDEPESTVYVLIRPGLDPVMADWPHPLRELCPDAVMAGTLGSDDWQRQNAIPSKLMQSVGGDALGLPLNSQRRSRLTGTLIRCWDNRAHVWPNMNGSAWVTECVEHQSAVGHRVRDDAVAQMRCSDEWCDKCEPLDRGIGRTQVRGDTTAIEVLSKLEALYGSSGGKTE